MSELHKHKPTVSGRISASNPAQSNGPRPQHLPPITPEGRAMRAAMQARQAERFKDVPPLDLSATEARIAEFFAPPRHPATNIGE